MDFRIEKSKTLLISKGGSYFKLFYTTTLQEASSKNTKIAAQPKARVVNQWLLSFNQYFNFKFSIVKM